MKGSINRLPVWIAAVAAAVLLALTMVQPQGSSASQQEKRIAEVLSAIAGAGKVEVVLYYAPQETDVFASSASASPTGAVVVAQGADDPLVELQLRQALCALLGIPDHAVSILTGGK